MDKKLILTLLLALLMIIVANSAAAAVEITVPEIVFTADYGDFNDEDQRVVHEALEIPVKNTESRTITVVLSITNLPSNYNVPALSTITLLPGESKTLTISLDVPHQQDSGRAAVGVIELRDAVSNVLYDNASLVQNTKSMLKLDEITVDYINEDGESESENFDGDSQRLRLDRNVQPGSSLTITLSELENAFDKDYDEDSSEIEDITITLEADNDDLFKGDFIEEYELKTLEAETKEDFVIVFNINELADEDEYIIKIKIEGEDGEGLRHTFETELILQIERSARDLRITKFKLSPENPTVCEEKFVVDLEVKNLGTRSQEDIIIQLYSPSLGILENIPVAKLDRYSKKSSSLAKITEFNLKALPFPVKSGRYDLELNVFLDNQRLDNQRQVVEVMICDETQPSVIGNGIEVVGETDKVDNQIESSESRLISSGRIVRTVEDPYTNEDVLMSLIIITIILLLAIIAIFMVTLIKNKSLGIDLFNQPDKKSTDQNNADKQNDTKIKNDNKTKHEVKK